MFTALIEQAETAVTSNPKDPELLIWQGIIKSSYAGKAGGLGALGFVKAAKISLEKAMELDDMAMAGSAYTSLGALYYQVPGWPIAFGSDKQYRTTIAGLTANTRYYYEVNLDGALHNGTFRTAPSASATSTVIYSVGDTRSSPAGLNNIMGAMLADADSASIRETVWMHIRAHSLSPEIPLL